MNNAPVNVLLITTLLVIECFVAVSDSPPVRPLTDEQFMEASGWRRCGTLVESWYEPGRPHEKEFLLDQTGTWIGWQRPKFGAGRWRVGPIEYVTPMGDGIRTRLVFHRPLRLLNGHSIEGVVSDDPVVDYERQVTPCGTARGTS